MNILLVFLLLKTGLGDTIKNQLILEDQKGKKFYLNDTLEKYVYSVVVYSHYKQAKLGKMIRKELEKSLSENKKNYKTIEVANLSFVKNAGLFKSLVKAQFKIIKRQILLDYDGILEKEIGFEKDKLNVYIFEHKRLKTVILGIDKEKILRNVLQVIENEKNE